MSAQPPDWLSAFRRAAVAQREILDQVAGIAGRTVYDGIGEGGDASLVIDLRSEDAVFEELEQLAADGTAFTAISEERGEVSFNGGSETRVVIDPIDGSMNARRTLPTHALSIAVAEGSSMADVELAFVHDFGAGEEFVARRGAGAELDGRPIAATGPEGHGLEVVGLESAKPEWVSPIVEALHGEVRRIRVIGTIAMTMAYVACGRLDAMASARSCRSVDAAAAQLIVREAGGVVGFEGLALDETPLDLDARYRVAAATEPAFLETITRAQAAIEDPGREGKHLMSQENVAIVEAIFNAWQHRNPEAALSRIDPDVEVDLTSSSLWGQTGIARGHDALARAVVGFLDAWEAMEFFPEAFIDAEPEVIVWLRITGRGKTSGASTERHGASVYTVRDGLVVRWRAFETLSDAAKAVGI